MVLSLCVNISVSVVAILIGFEGECSVIIEQMSLRLRTYMQYNSFFAAKMKFCM